MGSDRNRDPSGVWEVARSPDPPGYPVVTLRPVRQRTFWESCRTWWRAVCRHSARPLALTAGRSASPAETGEWQANSANYDALRGVQKYFDIFVRALSTFKV
jgi:hypothetical protein